MTNYYGHPYERQFYEELKEKYPDLKHEYYPAKYTYLNTEHSSSGLPVGAWAGIIAAIICCSLVACFLIRYIFFQRKYQDPDNLEMNAVNQDGTTIGQVEGQVEGHVMSLRSINDNEMENNDIYGGKESLDQKVKG